MGYNNENSARIVFDIETAPLSDAADYLEPAEAPANYKDPVKITEYIAAKQLENLSKCSLDVDLCRVVAMGWQEEGGDIEADVVKGNEMDEASLIHAFWHRAADRHLVGFNCLAFDLPVLLRRSQYLGIPVPTIQIDKYKHPTITDLQMVLSFNGAIRFRGLSFYAKRFGIPSEDTLTGADIPGAVSEGRWEDVQRHVESDVRKTAVLAGRLGLFRQPVAMVF